MASNPSGPAPITTLQGFRSSNPQAPPWEVQGGPADPAHALPGEVATPYPWQAYGGAMGLGSHGPYGIENELLGAVPPIFAAGQIEDDPQGDQTPYATHAAPWPKGLQQGELQGVGPGPTADKLVQSAEIHSADTNASANWTHDQSMFALQDQWTGFYNPVQGEDLVTGAGTQVGQAVGGFGVNDHTSNPFHKANEYELNTSHRHRRFATGSVPGNYLWMRPGGRMMIKSLPGPARPPIGADSPFAGDDAFAPYEITGAILQNPATEYVPPATPYVQPATQSFAEPVPVISFT